jgi:hypothetical protein
MNPDYWILDEKRYFELVDAHTAKLNADLKERFRLGAKKKGATVDLSSRDFVREKWEEQVDEVAYSLMEEERVERAKDLL